jgi:4-amino-4-deoxy-L-arabinose transferase-like glycosyltransferase
VARSLHECRYAGYVAIDAGGVRRARHLTLAVLVLALVVRLGSVAATPQYTPVGDPLDYETLAKSITEGRYGPRGGGHPGPTAYRPPLYPFFLGAVYEVAPGSPRTWARAIQAVLGTVTVWLVGVVAGQLFGRRVGFVALAVAAVWPPMWLLGTALLSEVLFVPLVLGAVACLLRFRQCRQVGWVALAGLLLGLAGLTRANAPVLLLALTPAVWPRGKRRRSAAAYVPVAALVAVALLTVAPWTVRNANAFGRFVPVSSEDGYTLAGTYNEVARAYKRFPAVWYPWYAVPSNLAATRRVPNDELAWNDELRDKALDFARDHPRYVVKVAFWNLRRDFDAAGYAWLKLEFGAYGLPAPMATIELAAFWPVALLAILGLVTGGAKRVPRWLWGVPAALLLTIFFVGYARLRAPVDPFIVMLAALGLTTAIQLAPPARRRRRALGKGPSAPGTGAAVDEHDAQDF